MNKIEALQKTIYNLENDVYPYDWTDTDNCNCGILAKTITGENATSIGHEGGHWRTAAICLTTKKPLTEVFQALSDTGFTYDDIINLEYYGDKRIADALGYKQLYKENGQPFGYINHSLDDKQLLIKYLRAWVAILQSEQPVTPPPLYPDLTKSLAVLEDRIEVDIVNVKNEIV